MNIVGETSKDKTPIRTRKGAGESKGSNETPDKTKPGNGQGRKALSETHEGASADRVAIGRTNKQGRISRNGEGSPNEGKTYIRT
jgi:hypothetical protein